MLVQPRSAAQQQTLRSDSGHPSSSQASLSPPIHCPRASNAVRHWREFEQPKRCAIQLPWPPSGSHIHARPLPADRTCRGQGPRSPQIARNLDNALRLSRLSLADSTQSSNRNERKRLPNATGRAHRCLADHMQRLSRSSVPRTGTSKHRAPGEAAAAARLDGRRRPL